MIFYELAVKGVYLDNLIYHSEIEIENLQEVMVDLANKKDLKAIVLNKCEKPKFKTKAIKQANDNFLTNYQFELAKFISYYYASKLSFVLSFFETLPKYKCFKTNLLKSPNLNEKQEKAKEFIKENNTSLLFADTGSGKTEIYISLIKEYLEKGEQVLLLMPEIALTPQMQKRLSVYFEDNFIMWHSKISKKKKNEYLSNLSNSKALLVAGARSALFLPFRNLKLIIIDEEHDNSYKANNNPKINARDLALFIGKKMNIKILLGSATPSVSSFYKHKNYRIKGTFFESKKEFLYDDSELGISNALINELKISLDNKKQAIIFLPNRANFRQIKCKNCANIIKCPFCSVSLSLHKNILKCHYCNFSKLVDQKCEICQSELLEAKKIGTEQLKQDLSFVFKDAKIEKFDSDEITSIKKLNSILNDFNNKKIDILVGTSMLAKGHDYHSVDLSVILGLDEYLFYPNFKAREQSLALAMQVAGRAGRKGEARVFLQTKHKDFFQKYIQNYDLFLNDELEFRKDLYPPFKRLLRIIIEDKNKNKAIKTCENLVFKVKEYKNLELVGYGSCGIEYINSKYRFYVLLRSDFYQELVRFSHFVLNFDNAISDIDPIEFS